jgi:hypothetical protein
MSDTPGQVNPPFASAKKCKYQHHCKKDSHISEDDDLFECSGTDCRNWVHIPCYEKYVLNKDPNKPRARLIPENGPEQYTCKIGCYTSCSNRLATLTRFSWTNDSKNGPEDHAGSSEGLLIEWMTTGNNYSRYRGNRKDGKSKNRLHDQIADLLNEKGVLVKRTSKSVANKIGYIERNFRIAHDWAGATGVGVQENDPAKFEEVVKSKCQYYYDLLDVMKDRASGRPPYTNYDIDANNTNSPVSDLFSADKEDAADADFRPRKSTDDDDNKDGHHLSIWSPVEKKRKSREKQGQEFDESKALIAIRERKLSEEERHNKVMEQLREKQLVPSEDEMKRRKYEAKKAEHDASLARFAAIKANSECIMDNDRQKEEMVNQYLRLKEKGLTSRKIVDLFPNLDKIARTIDHYVIESDEDDNPNMKDFHDSSDEEIDPNTM